jgi:flagellar M-ring protein FliF
MNKFRQFIDKLLMLWSTLEGWQKLTILLAICGVLILLIFIIVLGSSPSYVRLFSDLETDDQAKITDHLRGNGIPYRLEPSIKAIYVPKNQVDEVRLSLAQAGLPKNGNIIDFREILNSTKFGMTDQQLRIIYIRALEEELTRTLKKFDFVDDAKVNIVFPEQRLFMKDQTPSSAAVIFKLRPGYRLTRNQVQAVVNLVTGSVQGLKSEKVTVADTHGTILSDMIGNEFLIYNGDGSISSARGYLERDKERAIENAVKEMLEAVFGVGKVVVKAAIELNLDKEDMSSTEYIPNEEGRGVPRSDQAMKEEYEGTGGAPGGAPGTTSNVPGYALSTAAANSSYSKSDTIRNYEISTTTRKKISVPGDIRRLTASVIIDGEFDDEAINVVKELVSSAIAIDEQRNDRLTVKAIPFSRALRDITIVDDTSFVIKIIVGSILFILGIILSALWWKRRKAMLAMNKTLQEARHIPTIQEMLTSPEMIAAQGELSVLEEQIKAYARSNPKEVASLVNEWLSED